MWFAFVEVVSGEEPGGCRAQVEPLHFLTEKNMPELSRFRGPMLLQNKLLNMMLTIVVDRTTPLLFQQRNLS